jgi:Holliday junction resolvase RusA-like endonuclease
MRLEFTIPLPPVAQKRSRSRAIQIGGKWTAMNYKAKDQRVQEDNFRALLYEHRPEKPLEGALKLWVMAFLPIPKSKSKKWKQAALDGDIRPTGKPDCSNLIKHLEDICNGIIWQDDKLIVDLYVEKYYSDRPRWVIVVEEL